MLKQNYQVLQLKLDAINQSDLFEGVDSKLRLRIRITIRNAVIKISGDVSQMINNGD